MTQNDYKKTENHIEICNNCKEAKPHKVLILRRKDDGTFCMSVHNLPMHRTQTVNCDMALELTNNSAKSHQ